MKQRLSIFLASLVLGVLLLSHTDAGAQVRRYRVGYKDEGFSIIPEVGALLPANTYDYALNFNLIAGMQINSNWFVGGGVALDAYSNDLYVPIFADARYFFLDKKGTPYAFLDAGYGLPVDANPYLKGGMMLNPGFGLKYFLTRTAALNLSLGYRYQSMPLDYSVDGASTSNRTNFISSMAIRVGMQF